jgi:phosphopantothenoylcysteine decarboxylase / phosphopantothenate---cysteine ligase
MKNIIVGITGGIAAYKVAELVRKLRNAGAKVRVVMTKNAKEFITPLTMQTLSGETVYTEMFKQYFKNDLEHITLARWADAIVVAPATANFIAKLAHGLTDDLLSTVCLATTAPIAVAPAMNKEMWHADATQKNIAVLKKRRVFIFGPATGTQACGEVGLGRMLEPQQILELIPSMFATKIFYGKKIVITAGPTRENIDPVRYLSNYSSGKMGYALAEAAFEAGASVTIISGPTTLNCSEKIKKINIQTAREMHQAVMKEIKNCDTFIGAAAIADYQPSNIALHKIKKGPEKISLELQRTPDILTAVASLKKKPFVVGFAAETKNLLPNAKEKLIKKKLDMIIANQVGQGIGFDNDDNSVIILPKNAKIIKYPKMSKKELAQHIIKNIYATMKNQLSKNNN